MAEDGTGKKRLGRPPVSDEKRRRGQLTFRIRADLRTAYERRAEQNGCSISEEIEKTLERDALLSGLILQKDDIILQLKDSIIYQKNLIDGYNEFCESLKSNNKKTMLMIEAFLEASYSKIGSNGRVEFEFGTKDEVKAVISTIRLFLNQDLDLADPRRSADVSAGGGRRTLSPVASAKLKAQFGDLAGLSSDRDAVAAYFERLDQERGDTKDFSLAALRALIGRLGEQTLALVPRFAPHWPKRFEDLPADTRSALIGHLRHDATSVYQALMAPKAPHDEVLRAFRRLRDALLPRESVDEDVDEGPYDGPDEDLDGVPDQGRGDVGKQRARARR